MKHPLVCALAVFVAGACGGGDGSSEPEPSQQLADSVATIEISPTQPVVGVGANLTLSATLFDSSGIVVEGPRVEWSAQHTNIARVSDNGVLTGVAVGITTVTATVVAPSGNKTGSVEVSVIPAEVAHVTIFPGVFSVVAGRIQQLTATATDAQGNVLTGRIIQWASTTAAAIVDDLGRVTGIIAGSGTITATVDGVQGSATVTVTAQ